MRRLLQFYKSLLERNVGTRNVSDPQPWSQDVGRKFMGASFCQASLASCNTDGAWDRRIKKMLSNAWDDRLSVKYFRVEG